MPSVAEFHEQICRLAGMYTVAKEIEAAGVTPITTRQIASNVVIEQFKDCVTTLYSLGLEEVLALADKASNSVVKVTIDEEFRNDVIYLGFIATEYELTTDLYTRFHSILKG